LMTAPAVDALAVSRAVLLRTERHPAVASLSAPTGAIATCDDLYEAGERIGDVYAAVVERVVAVAAREGSVTYAVPGSPMVAEHTVELLLADDRVDVHVIPALSFVDLAWVRLGVDPFAEGARIVDGHRVAVDAAGE